MSGTAGPIFEGDVKSWFWAEDALSAGIVPVSASSVGSALVIVTGEVVVPGKSVRGCEAMVVDTGPLAMVDTGSKPSEEEE